MPSVKPETRPSRWKEPETVVNVWNLTRNTHEDHLQEVFGHFGLVKSVTVELDDESGISKGFGYVEFETRDGATRAQECMNGGQLDGGHVKVEVLVPESSSRGDAAPFRDNASGPNTPNHRNVRSDRPPPCDSTYRPFHDDRAVYPTPTDSKNRRFRESSPARGRRRSPSSPRRRNGPSPPNRRPAPFVRPAPLSNRDDYNRTRPGPPVRRGGPTFEGRRMQRSSSSSSRIARHRSRSGPRRRDPQGRMLSMSPRRRSRSHNSKLGSSPPSSRRGHPQKLRTSVLHNRRRRSLSKSRSASHSPRALPIKDHRPNPRKTRRSVSSSAPPRRSPQTMNKRRPTGSPRSEKRRKKSTRSCSSSVSSERGVRECSSRSL